MEKGLLLTGFLLFVLLHTQAIEIHSYTTGVGEELPSADIRSIAQDDKGYMWFGTTNGLMRYDGYTFNTFFVAPSGNRRLLFDNHIRDLLYWKENLLVIKVQGPHYVLFDTDTDQFMPFPVEQSPLLDYDRIIVDDQQRLWIFNSRREGVCVTCQNRQFSSTTYDRKNPLPLTIWPVPNTFYDNLGNWIEIENRHTIVYHDAATGRAHTIQLIAPGAANTSYMLRYTAVTQDNLVWISTYGYGIVVYDKTTGTTTHIRRADGLIQSDFILKVILDRQGNIWALQEYRGAVCLSVNAQSQRVVSLNADNHEEPANYVKALATLHDGRLLASNNFGEMVNLDEELHIASRSALGNHVILSVCEDRQHRVWMGSRDNGVYVKGRWFSADNKNANTLSNNKVNSMVCDRVGRMWLAPQDGQLDVAIGDYDTGDIRFRHFLSPNHYFTLAIDHRGHIWAGTQSHVYSFDPEELLRDSTAYKKYDIGGSTVDVNDIGYVMEDSHHRIWIGTAGKGVFVCDNDGSSEPAFRQISTTEGLVNNMVASILEDASGTIWIATQQGITCYEPETGKMRNIFSDAVPERNFYTDRAASRLSDGRLAFGTIDGVIVYAPDEDDGTPKPTTSPLQTLRITDILVNGIAIHQWDDYAQLPAVPTMGKVILRHQENSVTFRFSDFNYNALGKTKYSYQLQGYDKQWSPPSTASYAAYRDLPHGNYTFQVKAIDDSKDTEQLCQMTLVIKPPLWLSWWAWCVYLVLAVIVGYIVYRYLRTVYRLRQSVSLEKQMTEFKLRFFTNISHEFRTPLTIIHGSLDRIRHQKQLPGDLKQPLSNIARSENRMMRLINQLLEFRKMENGKLQLALQETDIVIFLHNIFNGFVEVAENKHINFTFHTQVRTLKVFIDRGHVDKIAYNLLSNAFKYTPLGGEVSMRIQVNEALQRFTFSVTDTGVGIPKEKQAELFQRFTQSTYRGDSMGIGLNLTKELVEVHHGNIIFSENQPKGSIFTVDLPRDKSVYSQADFLKENNELIKEQGGEEVNAVAGEYREMAPKPLNDRTIMVVEDDADVLKYIKSLMGQYFNVVTAVDGNDALNQLEAQTVDLIITDVMMPVMNGYELTRKLNADERYQDIPVIMLTAVSDSQFETKGLDVGADAYLTKPFDNDVLVSTCISLIGKRDLLRKRFAAEQREDTSLPKVVKEEADGKFIAVFDTWIEQHLGDTSLSVDDMAAAMQLGRTVFYQKVKALTGMTPNDYLRNHRLDRAASMLKEGHSNVSEVAYKTGFASPHNFTASFKQKFGTTPKKYQMGKVTIQRQVHDEASNLK